MYSQTGFTPGNKSFAKRMMNYNAFYNQLNANSLNQNLQPPHCACIGDIYNKSVLASNSTSTNISYNTRISQIIKTRLGGSTQYGNFYLGQPLQVNCFGRVQGMPGGSGMPPLNKF
uniref:Uncharacterized protein n=1 Tax=viral metagenome TaxID=1070528 RepID=A0A6C0EPY7_9ZZZZ